MVDQAEIHRMARSGDVEERKRAAGELNGNFAILPDKKKAWNDLIRLSSDINFNVFKDAACALGGAFEHVPDKIQAWDDLHMLISDNDSYVRRGAAYALGSMFEHVFDKKQAWNDLIMLTSDNNFDVRESVECALSRAFLYVPDKEQAWDDLIRLISNTDSNVRRVAASALGAAFPYIPEKHREQAWNDLHKLTQDKGYGVRWGATEALGAAFFHIPEKHKDQAWKDLHRMTQDKCELGRCGAAEALGAAFPHIPEKHREQAWNNLIRLTQDLQEIVRVGAVQQLGAAFPHIPENHREQAWGDLIRLTQNKERRGRWRTTEALGTAFPHIPEKLRGQAWNGMISLMQDEDEYVRAFANHSLGRASIFKATKAGNDEDFRKELEKALGFFESSSKEAKFLNPARFCFPFYRSFYTLTFRKQEIEDEVKKCLAEAKSAVKGSESEEKLVEAVENLANALKEVQKARDFSDVKSDLNAYRRYCERASELLDTTEDKAPSASRLIRKGLPFIDERIKGIITEIQEKAKALCMHTQGTLLAEQGKEVNIASQNLINIRDPIGLDKAIFTLEKRLGAVCEKMPEHERGDACSLLSEIKDENYLEDKINLVNILIEKMSAQIERGNKMGKYVINNSTVQIIEGNNNVQTMNLPQDLEKESIKKPPLSIDEKIQQKTPSIEQILDNCGFRPGGFSHGTREQKKADIEKWLRRFLPGEFEDAFLILERIQYHDSHAVDGYMEGLSRELKQIFENDLSDILFYPLGESPASSGGNLLYSFRKYLGLSESSFPYVPFKDIDLSGKKAIVFFDDIIGSGNQAVRFAKNHLQDIKIDKYYITLMAFEKGLEKVRNNGCFKKVIVHERISEELRAFSPESQVFPDADTRERIKRLCEKYGALLYPKHPLGYDDSQALIVFPHNTPNNSLPIIWASDKNEKEPGYVWYPVWERIKITVKK